MESKVVLRSKFDGQDLIIRYPMIGDAELMTEYINVLSLEKTFITYQGEKITLEDERVFLEKTINDIFNHKSVMLLAFVKEQLVGISSLQLKQRTSSHVGRFAISVARDFRGKGVGQKLMETTLEEAEKNIPNLRIIVLSLFEGNTAAFEMYKKFGFCEYGRLSEGIHFKDSYIDHIYMYKQIKD